MIYFLNIVKSKGDLHCKNEENGLKKNYLQAGHPCTYKLQHTNPQAVKNKLSIDATESQSHRVTE